MTRKESSDLLKAAIANAEIALRNDQKKMAYHLVADAASKINGSCQFGPLRNMFSRPGGSWASMGFGTKQWLLTGEEYDLAMQVKNIALKASE